MMSPMTGFWGFVRSIDPQLVRPLRAAYRRGRMQAVWALAEEVLASEDLAALRLAMRGFNRAYHDAQKAKMDAAVAAARAANPRRA